MAATTFHSVIIVFWKETAFSRWRAMDRRWKRNSFSLVSSVTTVMRRPISCVTSMAVSCHAPAVSMANGQKMWVLAKLAYLYVLFCAALWAAAPALTIVLLIWDSAYVSGTVTSQVTGLPLAHGSKVVPSGLLLLSLTKLTGSLAAGIWARFSARQMMSFGWLWRCCMGALLRQDSPCSPWASTGFLHTHAFSL